jgi:FkbM family methyltransferase
MYLIQEKSYGTEHPLYQKIEVPSKGAMFIPEARVAKDYVCTGFYERGVLDWVVQTLVDPNKVCIDIGAHVGWYTVDMAKKAAHVYSFECSPKSFNYLCANIELNNLSYRVTKYNTALGSTSGTTPYYIRDPKDGGGNGTSKFQYDTAQNVATIDVPVRTLDSFELANVGFIKIDVEGSEKKVLEGAVDTLKRNNYPKILFESWDESKEEIGYPSIQLRKELFEFLRGLGYSIIPIRGNSELFLAERVS